MKRLTASAIAALLAAALAAPAHTFSIDSTTRAVDTAYVNFPTVISDHDTETHPGPPLGTSISARVDVPMDRLSDPLNPAAPGYGRAAAGPSGFTDAMVAGRMTGSGFGDQTLSATVSETLAATAPPRPGTYQVAYSFDLFNMFFEFWDDYGLTGRPDALESRFKYDVRLVGDDAAFYRYSATAYAWDGLEGFDVSASRQLNEVSSWVASRDPADGHLRIDFSPVSIRNLVLGTISVDADADLETFAVATTMSIETILPDGVLDVGARVGISDPNGLTVNSLERLRLIPVDTPVPAPATLALIALGLAGIAGTRRGAWRGQR